MDQISFSIPRVENACKSSHKKVRGKIPQQRGTLRLCWSSGRNNSAKGPLCGPATGSASSMRHPHSAHSPSVPSNGPGGSVSHPTLPPAACGTTARQHQTGLGTALGAFHTCPELKKNIPKLPWLMASGPSKSHTVKRNTYYMWTPCEIFRCWYIQTAVGILASP